MLNLEYLQSIDYASVKNITSEEYFSENELAVDLFKAKYCKKLDSDGNEVTGNVYDRVETPAEVFMRVASGLASMEDTVEKQEYYTQIWFALMWLGWFRPGGSVLAGVEVSKLKSLLNCFSRDTEFITSDGVKSFLDYNDGDIVEILSTNGVYKKAKIKKFGQQHLYKVVFRSNSLRSTVRCTSNHLWKIKSGKLKKTINLVVEGNSKGLDADRLNTIKPKIGVDNASDWVVEYVEPLSILEEVWCVVEPESHMFTLKHGIPTHNCTTVAIKEDTLEAIAQADYEIMKCAAFRQGLGFDASKLRPKGAPVNNAAEESTGAVPWIEKLVDNGKWVGQKARLPAILVSLKDYHPDIVEFITAKIEKGKIENANMSVQISNAFMEAVKNDDDWELYFEFEEGSKYDRVSKTIKAKELFDLIAETAYKCLHKDVKLPVIIYDRVKLMSISDIEATYTDNKYLVPTLSVADVKSGTNIISKVVKHKNYKKMLKIYTSKGITYVTENHPFAVYNDDLSLDYIKAKDLKRRDKIIHLFNKKYLNDHIAINNAFIFNNEKYTSYNSTIDKFLDNFNDQSSYRYKKNKRCSLRYLQEKHYEGSINNVVFTNNKRTEFIKFPIKIGKYTSFFAGLLLADGSIHGTSIRISCNSKEVSFIKKIIKNVKEELCFTSNSKVNVDTESVNSSTVIIYDGVLTTIMKELCYDDDEYKLVTNYFMEGPKILAAAFMSGLCYGDGSVYKGNQINLCICDEKRFNTITELLTLHNLPYNVSYSWEKTKNKVIKGRAIKNVKNCFHIALYNTSIDKSLLKNTRLDIFMQDYIFRVPVSYKYSKYFKTISESSVLNNWSSTAKHFCKSLKTKLLGNSTVDSATILKTEEIYYNDYVYDITVDNDHNFVTSNGLLLKNCSEPGVQYIDLLREGSMVHQVYKDTGDERFKIISTNACCFTKENKVLTDKGSITIQELQTRIRRGELFKALSKNKEMGTLEFKPVIDIFKRDGGVPVQTITLNLENGKTIECTPDHKFYTNNRGIVLAKDLTIDDDLVELA